MRVTLGDIARYFALLGTTGFGGPVVLVERMRRDLHERRGWITDAEYREGIALAQIAPGPLAAQVAIYLGWLRGGIAGATVAGVAFVAPSFLMVMALSAAVAFAGFGDTGAPPLLRYVAVLAFSMIGGLIPGTLFATAVRLAPTEHTVAATVGWVQQWSAFGQFSGPPIVAWVASRAGGWHWTWAATGACSLAGLLLTLLLARSMRR